MTSINPASITGVVTTTAAMAATPSAISVAARAAVVSPLPDSPSSTGPVTTATIPFQVGLAGRITPPTRIAADPAVPLGIPPVIRNAIAHCRVLIVDDHDLTLASLKEGLHPWFEDAEGVNHPESAIQLLKQARDGGRPYDALVLDLRMPGMNGDVLLRNLAADGLLLPTVIHSGSHAQGIQHHILPQIEQMRTEEIEQRLRELDDADAAFTAIASHDDLARWRRRYVQLTDGVPLAFVNKRASTSGAEAFPYATLVHALGRVILADEETDQTRFSSAVAQFRPALWDGGDMTEYIEALAELARFIAGKAIWMKRLLESQIPEIVHQRLWTNFGEVLERLNGSEYSVAGMSVGFNDALKVNLGAMRRHNLPNALGVFARNLDVILRHSPEIRAAIEATPGLMEQVRSFMALCYGIGPVIPLFRAITEKTKVVEIQNSVNQYHTRGMSFGIGPFSLNAVGSDAPLYIASPGDLFGWIMEQLLLNATHWMKGREGEIRVSIGRAAVASLNSASQLYFRETHNLGDQDEVAIVEIADQGPGIAPEDLGRIFEDGFTTRRDGTGFGLSFVASHIGRLNGTIHVASTPGVGSRFFLYFLQVPPPSAQP